MNFAAGLRSSSDLVDDAPLKQLEALFRSRAIFGWRQASGSHGQKQNQAPMQGLGADTLHAICDE